MRLPYNLFRRDQFLRLLDKPPGRERIDEQAGGGASAQSMPSGREAQISGIALQDLVNRR